MKIVPYDTLIPDMAGIQPGIAWLLALVPSMLPTEVTRSKVTEVLENLQLKYANLHGKILQLESEVQEYAEGDVIVALSDTGDRTLPSARDLEVAEEALRTGLAEVIVQRGEQRLEKERQEKNLKYAKLYGDATKLVQSTSAHVKWRFTAEDVERWKSMSSTLIQDPWLDSMKEAIRKSQERYAEAEALKAVTATVATMGGDEVPDIDLDGFYLD